MHKALKDLPLFDPAAFREQTADWKQIAANATPGGQRVVVEWSTGRGPNCFVYPATERSAGIHLCKANSHGASDERYADFLEFEFVPRIVESLASDGHKPQVICVDLRPLQVQRTRRRAIEAVAEAKSGAAATAAH